MHRSAAYLYQGKKRPMPCGEEITAVVTVTLFISFRRLWPSSHTIPHNKRPTVYAWRCLAVPATQRPIEHTGDLEVRKLVILACVLPPLQAKEVDIEQVWVPL